MDPQAARDAYRRAFMAVGEQVIVRRITNSGKSASKLEAQCWARPMGIREAELMANVKQSDQHLLLLAEDLEQAQFPLPLKSGDYVVIRKRPRTIQDLADDATKSLGGVVVAFAVRVTG